MVRVGIFVTAVCLLVGSSSVRAALNMGEFCILIMYFIVNKWLNIRYQLPAGTRVAMKHLGCRQNQELISTNAELLQPANVTTLRTNTLNEPPSRIVDLSLPGWCTSVETGNHVNMTFTQPVVVEGIQSIGFSAMVGNNVRQYFVSRFSILYSQNEDGPLQLYSRVCVQLDTVCQCATDMC